MKLKHGLHLAYSTNVHRGENWPETFAALQRHIPAVKRRVSPGRPFGIGLRLSNLAAEELSNPGRLREFQHWLARNDCHVFTMNGFPFGKFHGARVKDNVYRPDWTSPKRLAYTNRLFDLLAQLLPEGVEGSVSTLPGSFKEFIMRPAQGRQIRDSLWQCVEHIAEVSQRTGRTLHLGLEPEPLCLFENTEETIAFFQQMRSEHRKDPRLDRHLGVTYDACHFAVEFEEPAQAIGALRKNGIKISKLQLSSALKTRPTPAACRELAAFADNIYLHQVVAKSPAGRKVYKDLGPALAAAPDAQARHGMARPLPHSPAQSRHGLVRNHGGPRHRRAGFVAGGPGVVPASGDGNLHLGSSPAGVANPQCRRPARGGIRMDAAEAD